MKKVMLLGIPPTYEYTGNSIDRDYDRDYYAANCGGSLIANSLCQIFDAEFVYETSDISYLNNKYDACILSFATHLDPNRDVSKITYIVNKLDMPVILPAVGITAYEESVAKNMQLHPSFEKLLRIVAEKSTWIGTRGHYSASVLLRKGFKNIVPIGCPTIFRELNPNLKVENNKPVYNSLFVYHFSASEYIQKLGDIDVLGQDFHDQFVFTDDLNHDDKLRNKLQGLYNGKSRLENFKSFLNSEKCKFYPNFQKWYDEILNHDFVFGPRLHGCLAAIGKGKPAVLCDHDLRIREIAEFFELPSINSETLKNNKFNIEYILNANFSKFNKIYPERYKNFVKFMHENHLEVKNVELSLNADFHFNYKDEATINSIILQTADYNNLIIYKLLKKVKSNPILRPIIKLIKRFFR